MYLMYTNVFYYEKHNFSLKNLTVECNLDNVDDYQDNVTIFFDVSTKLYVQIYE